MAIVVGTSSWSDPGFVEHWYPQGMKAAERLPYYAERFEAVELNSSFYAIPAESTVQRWVEATPDGFQFDVKLHRLLSITPPGSRTCPPICATRSRPAIAVAFASTRRWWRRCARERWRR